MEMSNTVQIGQDARGFAKANRRNEVHNEHQNITPEYSLKAFSQVTTSAEARTVTHELQTRFPLHGIGLFVLWAAQKHCYYTTAAGHFFVFPPGLRQDVSVKGHFFCHILRQ